MERGSVTQAKAPLQSPEDVPRLHPAERPAAETLTTPRQFLKGFRGHLLCAKRRVQSAVLGTGNLEANNTPILVLLVPGLMERVVRGRGKGKRARSDGMCGVFQLPPIVEGGIPSLGL